MSQFCIYSSQGDYQFSHKNSIEHFSEIKKNNVVEKFNKIIVLIRYLEILKLN